MTTGEASPATARRHAVHEAIRQAEARFDLLFREDGGVHVWAACRAEIARTLLAETRAPETHRSGAAEEGDLPAVDVYVQTTAVGDDARRNVRAYGCVHTQDPVRWLIDNGYRVLLLCDVADRLARHDRLLAVHSRQLRSLPAQGGRERAILPPEAVAF